LSGDPQGPKAARRRAAIEIALVVALVESYVWIWGGLFPGGVLFVAGGVLGVALYSAHRRGEGLREIGVRIDNLRPALRDAAAATIPLSALLIAAGMGFGRVRPDWIAVVTRLLWLVGWGFLQQLVLQGFVHRRLMEALPTEGKRAAATAAVFAICHLPNPRLMAATFAAGYVWAVLFRRSPNLLALALSHAVGSAALSIAFGPELLHGMRVGMNYFTYVPRPGS